MAGERIGKKIEILVKEEVGEVKKQRSGDEKERKRKGAEGKDMWRWHVRTEEWMEKKRKKKEKEEMGLENVVKRFKRIRIGKENYWKKENEMNSEERKGGKLK